MKTVKYPKERKEEGEETRENQEKKDKNAVMWFVPSIVSPSSLPPLNSLLHATFPYQFFQKQPSLLSRPFPRTSARRLRGGWLFLLECVASLLLVVVGGGGGGSVVTLADTLTR